MNTEVAGTTSISTTHTHTPIPVHAPALEARSGIYISPALLEPHESNLKARPAEKPDVRKIRVEAIAKSIAANGQHYPVLVVEVQSDDEYDSEGNPIVKYEYVDGGARVEAIRSLNAGDATANHEVWCSVVASTDDLFRTAVTSNLHRTQNSIMDMAYIIQEVRERNNWKGRGGQAKVVEYLGLPQNRISDYERLLRAPKPVRELIESGQIATVDAALLLLKQGEDMPAVANKAVEIARAEVQADLDASAEAAAAAFATTDYELEDEKKHSSFDPAVPTEAESSAAPAEPLTVAELKAKADEQAERQKKMDEKYAATRKAAAKSTPAKSADKPVVNAKHVAAAAKEVTGKTNTTLSRVDIIQSFDELRGLPYPDPAKEFLDYFVDTYAKGQGSEKKFGKLFDAAVGFDKNAAPPAPVVPAKKSAPIIPTKPVIAKKLSKETAKAKPVKAAPAAAKAKSPASPAKAAFKKALAKSKSKTKGK